LFLYCSLPGPSIALITKAAALLHQQRRDALLLCDEQATSGRTRTPRSGPFFLLIAPRAPRDPRGGTAGRRNDRRGSGAAGDRDAARLETSDGQRNVLRAGAERRIRRPAASATTAATHITPARIALDRRVLQSGG